MLMSRFSIAGLFVLLSILSSHGIAGPVPSGEEDVFFCIGTPDAFCAEFALAEEGGYAAYPEFFPKGSVEYILGRSTPEKNWPFIHPAPADRSWAKGEPVHPFTIKFDIPEGKPILDNQAAFVIGYVGTIAERRPEVLVSVNGTDLPRQVPADVKGYDIVFNPLKKGRTGTMLFTVPAGLLRPGENTITISLHERSWILYDYVALRSLKKPLAVRKPPQADLLAGFLDGPMRDLERVVFAVRPFGVDSHWYANFGYYADDENRLPYPEKGGKLCVFDLKTKNVTTLLDDPEGAVRDPQVHYDAGKILFSYRPGPEKNYHLYEIDIDGKNLRQLTSGEFDDIEPTYIENGDIVFVSSRSRRWVQCWLTPVATLHRCGPDGENIREISANVEHDNTPWPLPNGQILYTRWEYVDRSQVHYHHLWIGAPDGVRQTVFYGNLHPGLLMIDAKPIPATEKIVSIFSPGHGRREHAGAITVVDPRFGPDDRSRAAARRVSRHDEHRDPWAFSENAFLAAWHAELMLVDGKGREQTLYALPEEWSRQGLRLHEPRPILPRDRERSVTDTADLSQATGTLTLINVYEGRNMQGIKPGSIKKLLILETLPKPINFTGGMEPMTYGGSFTLERIFGTVPVEPDGSANFELPALRSFFFVALDENDRAVKRMQSFTSVMPGETTTCIGCHEERTQTPLFSSMYPSAARRTPSRVTPIAGIPEVIDYPRDIQPILDRHCVACHNPDRREGGVALSGDRMPLYSLSYYTITAQSLVADGRNRPVSNYPPYALGSGASRLMTLCDGSHYEAKLSPQEQTLLRLWIDTGATYPGTYAGLGSGMIGGYAQNKLDRSDLEWPEMKAAVQVLQNRCGSCHTKEQGNPIALSPSDEIVNPPWEPFKTNDARRRYSRQLLWNLSRPEKSTLLRAPLAKAAGGYQSCGRAVFESTHDPDYRIVLAAVERTKAQLDEIKRFDMPGFVPRPQYLREMKRFGVLTREPDPGGTFDPYLLDQAYWEMLHFKPIR